MPHTLTLRYRDALYAATVADLREGIPAMLLALNLGKFPFARVLRARNEAEMALLHDLGWEPYPDANGPFEVTLPDPQLLHVLHRIGRRSYEELTRYLEDDAAHHDPAERAAAERHKLATEICNRIIIQITPPLLTPAATEEA
ncbi:hypothetical protein [Conexibacter woesei]|uniref:Uncharacterized protein n=1 Tax=Conexibacter woesei (strain DSM 14684 / CCUG 47730 / CIP 108061 / JCM 11494 / NBRC 100937 / ID131577) TaxID=469383 RepID=D3F9G4_CONWI|nr:hypothetical protein [Conexibacter woesei]ADB49131.1 hypothetical protein Cwoe_0698 [Conexibacter woesei DSM 14684]